MKVSKRGQIFAPALTVLTLHTESHYILQGVRAGAKGVVLKTHASEDLVRAIREASRGGTYMSSQVSSALVQAWHPNSPPRPGEAPHPAPSARKSVIRLHRKLPSEPPASTQEVSESENPPATRGTAHSEV